MKTFVIKNAQYLFNNIVIDDCRLAKFKNHKINAVVDNNKSLITFTFEPNNYAYETIMLYVIDVIDKNCRITDSLNNIWHKLLSLQNKDKVTIDIKKLL